MSAQTLESVLRIREREGRGERTGKAEFQFESWGIEKPNWLALLPCCVFWKDMALKFPVDWHVYLI